MAIECGAGDEQSQVGEQQVDRGGSDEGFEEVVLEEVKGEQQCEGECLDRGGEFFVVDVFQAERMDPPGEERNEQERGQDPNDPDNFWGHTLQLNGCAELAAGTLRLTPDSYSTCADGNSDQTGSAFTTTPFALLADTSFAISWLRCLGLNTVSYENLHQMSRCSEKSILMLGSFC